MKQLLQNLRDGSFDLLETPTPARPPGFVLIANRASLISAGTERSTVRAAQASLLGKARQRPDKVQQVLDNLRKEGLRATVQKVREKLNQPKALGYSSSGVVLEADPGGALRAGDHVACAGQDYASHAEVVAVPPPCRASGAPAWPSETACW
jgi:polar amino acid transport system substrate-binding protein